jgi:hypothetical protein
MLTAFIVFVVLLIIATLWLTVIVTHGMVQSRMHDTHVSSNTFRQGLDGLRLNPRTDWRPDNWQN